MPQLLDLPFEILTIILNHLSHEPTTVKNLRLTSRTLNALVDNNLDLCFGERLEWIISLQSVCQPLENIIDSNFKLWSFYLDQETIKNLEKDNVSHVSWVLQHYNELKSFISVFGTGIESIAYKYFEKLAADATKARLLLYSKRYREFLFSHTNYLFTLMDKYEFVALTVLEKPDDLLESIKKSGVSTELTRTVLNIAVRYAAFSLLVLKDPTCRKQLLNNNEFSPLDVIFTLSHHHEVGIFIAGNSQLFRYINTLNHLMLFLSEHEDIFCAFAAKTACVEHLERLLPATRSAAFFSDLAGAFNLTPFSTEATLTTLVTALTERRSVAQQTGP